VNIFYIAVKGFLAHTSTWTRSTKLRELNALIIEASNPVNPERRIDVTPEQIAQVCHEANRAYCETTGDLTQLSWNEARDWQRESAIKGVEFALANPNAPASAQHDAWLNDKFAAGWKHGPVKDETKKEHPCCVPYDQLPDEQKVKDYLFKGIVASLRNFVAQPATA